MSYVTDFAAQYPTADYPLLLHYYYTYNQYQQAVIALKNAGAAVLADGGATADAKAQALTVMRSVLTFAAQAMPAFLGDATVLASATAPSDANMLTAATWILPTLKPL